jgi:hypothetical protein
VTALDDYTARRASIAASAAKLERAEQSERALVAERGELDMLIPDAEAREGEAVARAAIGDPADVVAASSDVAALRARRSTAHNGAKAARRLLEEVREEHVRLLGRDGAAASRVLEEVFARRVPELLAHAKAAFEIQGELMRIADGLGAYDDGAAIVLHRPSTGGIDAPGALRALAAAAGVTVDWRLINRSRTPRGVGLIAEIARVLGTEGEAKRGS